MLPVEFPDGVRLRGFAGRRLVRLRLVDRASNRGLRTYRRLQVSGLVGVDARSIGWLGLGSTRRPASPPCSGRQTTADGSSRRPMLRLMESPAKDRYRSELFLGCRHTRTLR